LIAAFSTYAGAVADARTALSSDDQAAIDQAAQRIDEANRKVGLANTAIAQLSADCGFEIATPVAG